MQATLRAFSFAPRRRRGGPEEPKRGRPGRRSKGKRRAQRMRALDLDLDLEPVWGGGGWTDKARAIARVSAMDRAHFAARQGWRVSETPAARSEPGEARRPTRVPFLLVTSLWASKEK